jgi:hypothetical protein
MRRKVHEAFKTLKMIMKKILSIVLLAAVFLPACKKAFEQPTAWSSVAVIQASPTVVQTPTVRTDTLQFFVDTMRLNSNNITYNTNTTYLPIRSGTKNINIRRGVNSSFTDYVPSFSYNFERGMAYSFFVYDTTTSATGQAKVLRLKDDLTLPPAGTSKVRFLHLAPNAPAVDVTLVRTSITPNDSVTISGRSYVSGTPDENALSAFTNIPRGVYTARVKLAGTQTVVLSTATTLLTATATGADVSEGRIVTLYATGSAKGRPLTVGSFRHY